jgi:hypothetical protein
MSESPPRVGRLAATVGVGGLWLLGFIPAHLPPPLGLAWPWAVGSGTFCG